MKVAPVSADLLIKLAIGAAVVGLGYYLFNRVKQTISDTIDGPLASLGEVADATIAAVNPASSENIINRGVTAIGDSIVSPTGYGRNADGSWTLGGWIYDITHDTRELEPSTSPVRWGKPDGTQPAVIGHTSAYWKS